MAEVGASLQEFPMTAGLQGLVVTLPIPELKAGHLLPPGHRPLQVEKKELPIHLLQREETRFDQGSLYG